jgi:hypothetical protein
MAIQNILPDPTNRINDAGTNVSGDFGPGFKSVSVKSKQPIMTDRTNSGRVIARVHAYHQWLIDISYNPLTKAEFDPIYNFLLHKQGSLKPFFVSLPQYRAQGPTSKTVSSNATAGAQAITLNSSGSGTIKPGMLFRINDPQDSNHEKAYMVTRVSGSNLTITPGLARGVTGGAALDFATPTIKVRQTSDSRDYSLNTNNLYSFSLKLEEASS